jgi:SGNH domain-containing protein
LSSHETDIDACAIRRAVAFTDHHGAIEAAAAKTSGAGLIDLTDRICVRDGPCAVVVNDKIVFRDQGHLTATFSRSLAPALGATIASVLAD